MFSTVKFWISWYVVTHAMMLWWFSKFYIENVFWKRKNYQGVTEWEDQVDHKAFILSRCVEASFMANMEVEERGICEVWKIYEREWDGGCRGKTEVQIQEEDGCNATTYFLPNLETKSYWSISNEITTTKL